MSEPDGQKNRHILVVDDEIAMRDLLKSILFLSGFEVTLAASGQEFREKAFSVSPDLIILDIMLGSEDGTQIYHELVGNGLSRDIPIIFLSALASDRPAEAVGQNRRFTLIGKPFDPEHLIGQVGAMLQQQSHP